MESTVNQTFLHKIRPPLLEDCALPPDAIQEAFRKAAKAVKSIISHDDDCLNDPWPTTKDSSDMLVGIEGNDSTPLGSCSVEKNRGGELGFGEDKVVVVEGDEKESADDVVGVGVIEGGESCVDGMQGLKIGHQEKKENDDQEEDNEKDKPILVEGFL